MGLIRPLINLFSACFKQTIQILQQINVKKCPSSIWCRDSNSQPSDYESTLLTTRPGLSNLTPLSLSLSLHHFPPSIALSLSLNHPVTLMFHCSFQWYFYLSSFLSLSFRFLNPILIWFYSWWRSLQKSGLKEMDLKEPFWLKMVQWKSDLGKNFCFSCNLDNLLLSIYLKFLFITKGIWSVWPAIENKK